MSQAGKYNRENERFTKWWDKITPTGKWTILERMAAHDAWMEAKGVFNT